MFTINFEFDMMNKNKIFLVVENIYFLAVFFSAVKGVKYYYLNYYMWQHCKNACSSSVDIQQYTLAACTGRVFAPACIYILCEVNKL